MISNRRFITGASIVEYIPIILAIALALTIGYKSFGDNVREQSAEISAQVAGYGSSNTGGSGNNGSQGNGSGSGNNGNSSDGNDSSNNDSTNQDSTSNDGQGGDSGSNNDSSTGDDNSSSGPIGGGGDSDNSSGGDSDGGNDNSSGGDSGGAVSDGDGDGDDQDTSFIDDAIEFTKGLYEGFKQQGRDFIAMLWSPIETAKQVGELVVNLVERPQETLEIIADELKNDAVKLISGTAFEKGQVLGENLSPAVLLKVVNRLANLPKLPDRGGNDTGSGCSSFLGDTEVVTDSGLVPIKDLDVNDLVLSRHDVTYTDNFNPITKLHSRSVSSYYMVIVGTNIIYTTEEHPFWVQGEGWVKASELEFGNAVATNTGDTLIKGVSKIDKEAQVFNLTVANDHTYFIEEPGLWVHNANSACDIMTQRFNQLLARIDDPQLREKLLRDAEVNEDFREAFVNDPSLVDSWKTLNELGADDTLRRNTDALEYLSTGRKNEIMLDVEELLGGHSKARHGSHLSMAEMEQRVMGNHPTMPQSRSALKFDSDAIHADAVNKAFNHHKSTIEAHFSSSSDYLELDFDYGSRIGEGFTNTGSRRNPVSSEVSTNVVRVAFRRDPNSP
ncbi:MAG: HINT domain-containing protein, partial [Pseudomonadales bacterium]|nr:HINT domain-containing protein [Pseudomonadales bacterium]